MVTFKQDPEVDGMSEQTENNDHMLVCFLSGHNERGDAVLAKIPISELISTRTTSFFSSRSSI